MAETTAIAWTDHTFNIAWGCMKVSPGCAHCYAERQSAERDTVPGRKLWGPNSERRTFGAKHWAEPLTWNAAAIRDGKRQMVFACSMCDPFEDHPSIATERGKLFDLIRLTPALDWQLLTKRPENFARFLPADWGQGFANVWLGVSIESADYLWRADLLRETPAAIRFISYEPALGPLDGLDLTGIDWVIYGGESGPGFRGHDLAWPRAMRAKCEAAGIAWFYKQSPAHRTEMGIELDGKIERAYPTPRRTGEAAARPPHQSDLFS